MEPTFKVRVGFLKRAHHILQADGRCQQGWVRGWQGLLRRWWKRRKGKQGAEI